LSLRSAKLSGVRMGDVTSEAFFQQARMVKLAVLFCRTQRPSLWAGCHEPRQKRPAPRDRRYYKASVCASRVLWIRLDSVAVEGRLVVIKKRQGMASSYDCSSCSCPAHYSALSVAPATFGLVPAVYEDMSSTGTYYSCNGGSTYYYDLTNASSWTSNNTPVIAMDSSVHYRADGIAGGTANVTGSYTACSMYDTNPDFSCPCISTRTYSDGGGGNVDSLVFEITSGGVTGDSTGVVSRTSFNLRVKAKSPSGVVPDTSFNKSGIPVTIEQENTSVGESAPSTISFSSGVANASITLVDAYTIADPHRPIYISNGNFSAKMYWDVFATDEGLVGQTTACGHVIQPSDHFVALPYSQTLCGTGVHLVHGQNAQDTTVEDVGPWCPHSQSTQGNTCVCSPDDYWMGNGIPYSQSSSCGSNPAGIDLADGTFSGLGLTNNAWIDWTFQ
jgi:hypothetical protein